MIKIYYLEENNIPFYIGKTKSKLHQRLSNHKNKIQNKEIKILLIDEVKEEDWKYWESYWIEQFIQWGFKLKNKNNGGGGPTKYSLTSIEKLKNSWTLKRKINHSKCLKGKKQSVETCMKKSKSMKGRHFHTIESKSKISKQLKGIKFSKERNKKIQDKLSVCVLQYNLNGDFIKEYKSIVEASNVTNISRSNISNSINNKLKENHLFIWKRKIY